VKGHTLKNLYIKGERKLLKKPLHIIRVKGHTLKNLYINNSYNKNEGGIH